MKGFKSIPGSILICGSSTVGKSTKNGFPYTSGGQNIIWDVFDETIKECGIIETSSFVDLVDEYKKIKFSNDEYAFIESFLKEDNYLYEIEKHKLAHSTNLLKAKNIQAKIVYLLKKYGFGLTDAISECYMSGTADTSRTEVKFYNNELIKLMTIAKVTILNGCSTGNKGTICSFRKALNVYGKKYDHKYDEIRNKYNVTTLPSTSGLCRTSKEYKALNKTAKIKIWADVLKSYIEISG